MQVLMVAASRYDFQDRETGQVIRGAKITYLSAGNPNNSNRKGVEVVTSSGPIELFGKVEQVPGYYDLSVELRPGPRGQATVVLRDLDFVAGAEIPLTLQEPVSKRG